MEKITAVIVTYKKDFLKTPSASILLKYAREDKLSLFIYENENVSDSLHEKNVLDTHSRTNEGLAVPYNLGLKNAIENNSEWLLLLDHDTLITASYLDKIINTSSKGLKAILPTVISDETVISPLKSDKYISLRNKENVLPGITDASLMAINSGSAISTEVLKQINGFNEEFKLDFLDHWLFWKLNFDKSLKYLVSDEKLEHSLSVQNIREVSLSRYEGILEAECKYYLKYNVSQLAEFKRTLILRTCKQFLLVKNRKFWKKTLRKYFEMRRR